MSTPIRQLVRHGAVFGIGAVVSRLASIVLLPLYTRHLTPDDYGIIAIIDIFVNLMAIAAGAGIVSAATREHCSSEDHAHHDRVWWTALAMSGGVATLVFGPALLARAPIAEAAFGGAVSKGATYLGLALTTMWMSSLLGVFESYFRTVKASTFLTALSLSRLVINVALNVVFIVWLDAGVAGILIGNLITVCVMTAVMLVAFARARGRFVFDRRLVPAYWRFGWPLVVFGLLSAVMHEADRYILRLFMTLRDVGLYSIAYQIGQGVNTLVIMPFTTVWGVVVYEVARRPDARLVYARVFREFIVGLALVLFGASLAAEAVIHLLAPPEYGAAANLVPIVCLAYLFFSLHEHFKVPALVSGRTVALLPVVAFSAVANVLLNFALIPRYGAAGAAWASVFTFALFSFAGLAQYRRLESYPYPFLRVASIVGGLGATFVLYRLLASSVNSGAFSFLAAAVIWMTWAAALFGRMVLENLARFDFLGRFYRRAVPPEAGAFAVIISDVTPGAAGEPSPTSER